MQTESNAPWRQAVKAHAAAAPRQHWVCGQLTPAINEGTSTPELEASITVIESVNCDLDLK